MSKFKVGDFVIRTRSANGLVEPSVQKGYVGQIVKCIGDTISFDHCRPTRFVEYYEHANGSDHPWFGKKITNGNDIGEVVSIEEGIVEIKWEHVNGTRTFTTQSIIKSLEAGCSWVEEEPKPEPKPEDKYDSMRIKETSNQNTGTISNVEGNLYKVVWDHLKHTYSTYGVYSIINLLKIGRWKELKEEPILADDKIDGSVYFRQPTVNSPNWQQYNSYSEEYTTQPEENVKMKERELLITVPTKPFAKTTTTTLFGDDIDGMSECKLYDVLRSIKERESTLLDLKTEGESKRITKQLKELSDARKEVVKIIDALED